MRKLVYILFFLTSVLNAQIYPTTINLDDVVTENFQEPLNIPEYLVPFTNEQGLTVTRISDVSVFGVNSQQLGNTYSRTQAWNLDESLLMLAGFPSAILNGSTYEIEYWRNILGDARWSNLEPSYMYGVNSNSFIKHNIITNQQEVLRTFNEFSSISIGYGEGNLSNDDRFVGLIGIASDARYYVVYDLVNDSYVTKAIPSGNLDWFSVSPLGTYAIANWSDTGSEINQGVKVYSIDLNDVTHVNNYTEHGDLGLLEDNTEVYVQYGNETGWSDGFYIDMTILATGEIVPLFSWVGHGNSGIWGGHVSLRSDRNVVYISESCCEGHGTLPSELFALHLDGSNLIERFGKHNSNRDLNDNGDLNDDNAYLHSPKLVPNRDGTKILFTSNWHNSEWQSLNSGYAFVVEVPQDVLSIPIVEENELPITTQYFNLLGQYLGESKPNVKGIYIEKSFYENRVMSKLIPIK